MGVVLLEVLAWGLVWVAAISAIVTLILMVYSVGKEVYLCITEDNNPTVDVVQNDGTLLQRENLMRRALGLLRTNSTRPENNETRLVDTDPQQPIRYQSTNSLPINNN